MTQLDLQHDSLCGRASFSGGLASTASEPRRDEELEHSRVQSIQGLIADGVTVAVQQCVAEITVVDEQVVDMDVHTALAEPGRRGHVKLVRGAQTKRDAVERG